MKKQYTISAYTENSPGVLHRLTVTFTKRKVNIESLTVCETEREGISRFTIVVRVPEDLIGTIVKQIRRIVEVREAFASEDSELVYKEIALIRVFSENLEDREKVEELAHRYGGKVVYARKDYLTVQTTGSEDEVRSLYELLEPHGIAEFVRSGRIAMRKDVTADAAATHEHKTGARGH